MFDIGFSELLVIFAIGLLILGPDKLPGVIKSITYWTRKARSTLDDAKSQINRELNIDEMQKHIGNYNQHLESVKKTITTSADIDSVNESLSKVFTDPAKEKGTASTVDTKTTTKKSGATKATKKVQKAKSTASKATSIASEKRKSPQVKAPIAKAEPKSKSKGTETGTIKKAPTRAKERKTTMRTTAQSTTT